MGLLCPKIAVTEELMRRLTIVRLKLTSINWDLLSVEIGFVVGFGIVVGPFCFPRHGEILTKKKKKSLCFFFC